MLELSHPLLLSFLNSGNLLGYHWQYFNIYTIELVKTSPCSGTINQTLNWIKIRHYKITEKSDFLKFYQNRKLCWCNNNQADQQNISCTDYDNANQFCVISLADNTLFLNLHIKSTILSPKAPKNPSVY
jgi:hypothetical protein